MLSMCSVEETSLKESSSWASFERKGIQFVWIVQLASNEADMPGGRSYEDRTS